MSGEHGCPFYQTFLSGVVVEQSSSDPKNMGSNPTESGAHFFPFYRQQMFVNGAQFLIFCSLMNNEYFREGATMQHRPSYHCV